MLKKFDIIILSMIITICSNKAESCNYKLLDMNADSFNERIWNKVHSSSKVLLERFNFLDYENQDIIEKYTQNSKFNDLYSKYSSEIKNKDFEVFSETCRNLYYEYENIDPLVQASAYMMYERVSHKVKQYYGSIVTDVNTSDRNTDLLPRVKSEMEGNSGVKQISCKIQILQSNQNSLLKNIIEHAQ